jgi:nicotinate-nucleotide adenylyltransferase
MTRAGQASRVGILGGTFDPLHTGHMAVAQAARHALGLEQVWLVPTRIPPHRNGTRASIYHRFAMAALGALSVEGVQVSDLELDTPGPSYTCALLDRLHADGYPPSQIVFITGADAFADIASWRRYPALLDGAHFAVVSRPRQSVETMRARLPELRDRFVFAESEEARSRLDQATPSIFLIDAPTPDVSSTDLRQRLQGGGSIGGLVPAEVERYIQRHGLYAAETTTAGHLHEHTPQHARRQ